MEINNVASRREFLKAMSTQELDVMLQAELRKVDIDDELVRLLLDILEKREADYPVETNEEVNAAVEKYTAYLDGCEATPAKPARKWSTVLKVASILVVVGLLIFVVPQAAKAESFFEMLARWTDSIFEFFSPGEDNQQPEYVFKTEHTGLQQIYDAVVELGITDPVVPMWVPDGFELGEIKIIKEPSELAFYANMKCNESVISISMGTHSVSSPVNHMKDTENIEVFEYYSIKHYIMSNKEQVNAVWTIDNMECSVVTDCQEDIYKILKSIYATED